MMLKKIIIISAILTIGSQAKAFDPTQFSALDIFNMARCFPGEGISDQKAGFMMRFASRIEACPEEGQNAFVMGALLAFELRVKPEHRPRITASIQKLELIEPGLRSRVEAEISSEYPWYKKA